MILIIKKKLKMLDFNKLLQESKAFDNGKEGQKVKEAIRGGAPQGALIG